MPRSVTVAAVQTEPVILQKAANLRNCLELTGTAARNGAQLLVFPECALTGYMFTSLDEALPVSEPVPVSSPARSRSICLEIAAQSFTER